MLQELDKKELIKYFRTLGLEVNTSTKARGHQGFFVNNRIDISKNVSEIRFIPTLLHEFAHYIHSRIEPNVNRSGGSLEKIFNSTNPIYQKELIKVTEFVDESSRLVKLYEMRDKIRVNIKAQELIVKRIFRNMKIKHINGEDLFNKYKDICLGYFNEKCLFISETIENNVKGNYNEFLKIRNIFKQNSQWTKLLDYNRIKKRIL